MMKTATLKARLETKVQALAKPTENMETAVIHSSVPVSSSYVALTNNAMEIIQSNLKKQPLSFQMFDIVKSPAGGSVVFSVPGLAGDEAEKELTGIILDYTTPRAYWNTPDPTEGTPPTCFSRDSITSEDGKTCVHCPFNTFGSKGGESNAKACKEFVVLFLLRPDHMMPLLVRIPVSSKLIFQRYLVRLIGRMLPLNGVVTKITLDKTTNKTGKPYARYNFEAVNILDQKEAACIKTFSQQFMELVKVTDITPTVSESS